MVTDVAVQLRTLKQDYLEASKTLAADESTLKSLEQRKVEIINKLAKIGVKPEGLALKIASNETKLQGLMDKMAYLIDPVNNVDPEPQVVVASVDPEPAPTIDIMETHPDDDDGFFPDFGGEEIPL